MQIILNRIRKLAKTQPDTEAVVSQDRNLNYRQLQEMIDATRKELSSLPIKRLAIFAENSVEWVVVDLAAAAAGIAVIPIPLYFSEEQIRHLLIDSSVDAVFGNGIFDRNIPKNWTAISHDAQTLAGKYTLLTHGYDPENQRAHIAKPFMALQKITYTSGSTGNPKGACLSASTLDTVVNSLSSILDLTRTGRHLCLLPFATLLENIAGIYVALANGRSIIVDRTTQFGLLSNSEFDAQIFCEAIRNYSPEIVILLPQMLKALLSHGDIASLSSLKLIAIGGGKVPDELLQQALDLGLPVYQGYGLTECASVVALNTPNANRSGSVGKPLPHIELRISGSGEVMVSGATMLGYLNQPVNNGEIATGDAGYIDDDGYLFITGRIKNTIVSSFGRNISPEWVESHFLSQPAIQQIAVFGEARPSLSAVIYAEKSVKDAELTSAIVNANAALPDYARITDWHRAIQPFSSGNKTLTNNGKLCREEIWKKYKTYLEKTRGAA